MNSSPIEHHIAYLTQCMRENITHELERQGVLLPFFQSLALHYIATHLPCTAHDVAMAIKKDKAQVTRLINELIKLELVDREQNPHDKRELILSLTESGQTLALQIKEVRRVVSARMTEGLDDEQQAQMQQWLVRMIDNLACQQSR
ncbi:MULTISPECIES: MarR family winged helix-turn-helix transcriptional regulator [Vibrio]|uniref:MarR family transcriptional regulator n=1 Tax=Vibrio ostreae TaxID=2841925 RepID=A0A975UCU1_9VIBR|nr:MULTISPECIES: MarR family transcriptional regulator [Vibrio]QXO18567.1 MarR family transcriptional regulator [Vibrio ostreae]WGY47135.1 MarR family transcriptional regulator [Vibrio sp. ABG19]